MRQNILDMQGIQARMELMQDELEEKEYNLTSLINSTDESLVAIDTNYKILVINNEVRDRYRGTAQSHIEVGLNILDFLAAEGVGVQPRRVGVSRGEDRRIRCIRLYHAGVRAGAARPLAGALLRPRNRPAEPKERGVAA